MTGRDDRGVAIVGMAALFPGAPDLDTYRRNLEGGFDAIGDVPASRWDPVYYEPGSTAIDRIYCKRGGFVDAYAAFDALAFGVMPASAGGAEPDQLLALQVAADALRDAGFSAMNEPGRAPPRERTAVILGRGGYVNAGVARLEQRVRTAEQIVTTLRTLVPSIGEDELARVKAEFQGALGPFGGGDTFIGLVPNLAASRIANRLDLQGPAYTIDAACASSLIAVDHACRELVSGRSDLVIAGGVHLCHEVTFWAGFCQLGAVSRAQQIRPFDRRADGLLLGEGVGMLVLRRLADAERDGDRIYAVIRGTGVASDGRDASLMTPRIEGQVRALEAAWSLARLDRDTVGLIEAHGTATAAGDAAELATLARFFGKLAPGAARAGLGTVKSMIGHAMPAAGAAGLIKAALAAYHGVLPPTLHCDEPHAAIEATRFRLIQRAEPWDGPTRRAGVNAFGFGGINAHVVIEAHASSLPRPRQAVAASIDEGDDMLLLAAASPDALLRAIDEGQREGGDGSARIAVFDPTPERVAKARAVVARGVAWPGRNDIWFSPAGLVAAGGLVAFVFPGVDASFEPRTDDVARHFGKPLVAPVAGTDLEAIGHGIISVGRLLDGALVAIGVRPDMVAGHSIGEWSGLIASGAIGEGDLDAFVGTLAPGTLEVPGVVFAAAGCGTERAEAALAGLPDIAVSHDNCPHQIIVCGVEASVDAALARLSQTGVLCQKLPFRSGYHSHLFEGFLRPYRANVASLPLVAPRVPLWSATTCAPYPSDPGAIGALVIDHLVRPVRFRELTLAMHERGARVFVQVGTGSLTGFLDDTLRGLPHLAISANVPQRSGMAQLRRVAAALFVEGAAVDLARLAPRTHGAPSRRPGKKIQLELGAPLVRLATTLRGGMASVVPRARDSSPQSVVPRARDSAPQSVPPPIAREFDAVMDEVVSARSAVLEALASGPRSSRRGRPEPRRDEGARQATYRRVLSVETCPVLVDHAFYPQPAGWPVIADRYPVVPLTMTLQMMLDAARELVPERTPVGLEDVGAYRWIAVEPPIEVTITARHDGGSRVEVAVEGYAVATVILGDGYPTAPGLASEPLVEPRPTLVSGAELYTDGWMFHGPAYQGITHLGPIAKNGIDGELRGLAAPGGLLDNAGQLFGYWVMEHTEVDRLAMPVGVKEVRLYGPEPGPGERVTCEIRVRHMDDVDVRADMTLAANGRLWARVVGWQDRRFDTDERSFPLLRRPGSRVLSEIGSDGLAFLTEPRRSIPSTERLIRRYLGGRERAELDRVDLRKRHAWLLARVVAKDIARDRLWKRGAGAIFPIEVQIEEDAQGVLVATGVGVAPVRIHVATGEGVAAAVIEGEGVARIEGGGPGIAIAKVMDDADDARASAALAAARGAGLGEAFVLERAGERLLVGGRWVETRVRGEHAVAWVAATG